MTDGSQFEPEVVSGDLEALAAYIHGYLFTHRLRDPGEPPELVRRAYADLMAELRGLLTRTAIERCPDAQRADDAVTGRRSAAFRHCRDGGSLAGWLDPVPVDREGAHVLVTDRPLGELRILLQHRDDDAPTSPGRWTIPGGGLECGEGPRRAALRELEEETGLALADLISAHLEPFGTLIVERSDGQRVRHHLFRAQVLLGTGIRCGEGQALEWKTLDEARALDLGPIARHALKGHL